MVQRPMIASILRAFVFAACQFFAYQTYGLSALVIVWAVIVVGTWIDVKTTKAKVAQTAVQTAWFVFILAVIHSKQMTF